MTGTDHPLLAFDAPITGDRQKPKRTTPRTHKPAASRQGDRIGPQFQHLQNAFANQRTRAKADSSARKLKNARHAARSTSSSGASSVTARVAWTT